MSSSVLVCAFRKSGIYPLNRNRASGEVLVPCTKPSNEEDSRETGSTQTTATVQAFDALEAALSTPARKKYRRRMEENYDLDGSKRSQQTEQTKPPNQTLAVKWCFKQGRQPPIS